MLLLLSALQPPQLPGRSAACSSAAVEALSSLLAVFFGRDPQASFAAGNVLARVLPDTEPQAADAAMQYFWHAGSDGIVQAADAREAPRHAKSGFVAAMLARAGQPFCSAAGFRPAGEIIKDPFIAQGFAQRCANLMQVLLISVQSATGPVAKLWREAIRSCLCGCSPHGSRCARWHALCEPGRLFEMDPRVCRVRGAYRVRC